MLLRCVVIYSRLHMEPTDRPGNQITFSWMEIAARWIDTQSPARSSRLLPSGKREGILEKLRDRAPIERGRRTAVQCKCRLIARFFLRGQQIKRQSRCPYELAKRIRL